MTLFECYSKPPSDITVLKTVTPQQYNISWIVWEIHLQLTKNVQLPLPSRQYDIDNQQ